MRADSALQQIAGEKCGLEPVTLKYEINHRSNNMDKQEWGPDSLLKLSGSYWQTCTLHAGVKLDLFTAINNEELTAGELALRLKADKRGLTMLLNALAAMNLLIKKEDKYANTPAAVSFLSGDSSRYIGYIIKHHHYLVDGWSKLDQAVETGGPVRVNASERGEDERESFLMGMYNMAMHLAPQVAETCDLSGRQRLLDLGGGPGTYAIHFCLASPLLKATVFDLPAAGPFALKTIKKFNLADRIDFMEGNYLEEELPGAYDAAWLSHIFHAESHENCIKIIRKTVSALKPGGMVMVHEFILRNTMDGPLFPALFSLNMLLGTPDGRSYSEEEIMDMLADAGVKKIQRVPLESPNDSGIIQGIVD